MDFKTCPDCEFEKVPTSVAECPDCGYKFEDDEVRVIEEGLFEDEIAKKIGIVSLISFDESGDKIATEIIQIQPGETLIFGRASKKKQPDVDLTQHVPDAGGISGEHFEIGNGILTDLGSTNGTYVTHSLAPDDLAPEVKEAIIDQKFSSGWRLEPPIKMQILVAVPLKPDEPYTLEDGTEFRADTAMLIYHEEEAEEEAEE